MKFILVVLGLYGAYYYANKHFEFHDTLVYAQKHPEKSWSGPVQYYVGLIYYQRSDYPKAQEAFSTLLLGNTTAYHAPRALMMLGDAAQYTRDWETAKDAHARYIEAFPNGNDIELAKSRLEMLRYQHP